MLINTEDAPRSQWRKGIIEETIKSNDGEVRTVRLKVGANKYLTRAINHCYPLELRGDESVGALDNVGNDEPIPPDTDPQLLTANGSNSLELEATAHQGTPPTIENLNPTESVNPRLPKGRMGMRLRNGRVLPVPLYPPLK